MSLLKPALESRCKRALQCKPARAPELQGKAWTRAWKRRVAQSGISPLPSSCNWLYNEASLGSPLLGGRPLGFLQAAATEARLRSHPPAPLLPSTPRSRANTSAPSFPTPFSHPCSSLVSQFPSSLLLPCTVTEKSGPPGVISANALPGAGAAHSKPPHANPLSELEAKLRSQP